jgi:adenylate cyclase
MNEKALDAKTIKDTWNMFLTTGGDESKHRMRSLFRRLPGSHRCKVCLAPFQGAGSTITRFLYNKRPSSLNPYLCNNCEIFSRTHLGGVEVELSLLFADVRGSTTIAEKMRAIKYHKLINRFYSVATKVMAETSALIDKIIGDQATGIMCQV